MTTPAVRSHYLYRLTDPRSGDFYIGVRSCNRSPESDGRYMGSGRWPRGLAFDRVPVSKSVLATFESRNLAEEAEVLLIDMVLLDPRCRNSVKTASESFKAAHCTYRGSARYLQFKESP